MGDRNLPSPPSLSALDGANSLGLPCVPQKPENDDSNARKDAARKYDVRVNSHYHVQDERAKDQAEHAP